MGARGGVLGLIGLGGALGTGARLALSLFGLAYAGDLALLATLAANCLGAGLIGYLAARPLSPRAQALWMTGFCGGFTTFSMVSLELVLLAQSAWAAALAYGALSLALWLAFAVAGARLGRIAR
jgi:fluoride exporter